LRYPKPKPEIASQHDGGEYNDIEQEGPSESAIPEVHVDPPADDDGIQEFAQHEHGVIQEQRQPSDGLFLPPLSKFRSGLSLNTDTSTIIGDVSQIGSGRDEPPADVERGASGSKPWFVLPLNAVLGSASIGLLGFLNTSHGGAQTASNVKLM
jgi:hypothetical protein